MAHVQSTDGLRPKHIKWNPVSILTGHFQIANRGLHANTVSLEIRGKALPIGLKETQCTVYNGLLIHYDFESAGYVLLDLEGKTTLVLHFDISKFAVRGPQLIYRVLIIEWTKEKPYLNNNIPNYYFTTAFYVFFVEDVSLASSLQCHSQG